MARSFCLTIPFEPHSKRSPSATYNHKLRIPIIIDPDKERKRDISDWILENHRLPSTPLSGSLELEMVFGIVIPESLSKKQREARLATSWALECKKDLDNMQKLYQDILNFGGLKGKIFGDDHQICYSKTYKIWSDKPCIFIYLRELTEPRFNL